VPTDVLPPKSLSRERFFVLVYERDSKTFTLVLRDHRTYNLGEAEDAVRYLKNVLGDSLFAEDVVDRTFNFHIVQVIPAKKKVVQYDIPFDREKLATQMMFELPKPDKPFPTDASDTQGL